jgi:hypothetical protein
LMVQRREVGHPTPIPRPRTGRGPSPWAPLSTEKPVPDQKPAPEKAVHERWFAMAAGLQCERGAHGAVPQPEDVGFSSCADVEESGVAIAVRSNR